MGHPTTLCLLPNCMVAAWPLFGVQLFRAKYRLIVEHSGAPQMPTRAYRPCLGLSHLVSKVLEFFELLDKCLSSDAQNTRTTVNLTAIAQFPPLIK